MPLREFESRESLAQALAQVLVADLQGRGAALLRVSGGSTPRPLFRALAEFAHFDWSKVWIGLVDERWVGVEDAASNEAFVKRELMPQASPVAAARFVGLARPDQSLDCAASVWSEMIDAGVPSIADALVLGMGADGHFASLFPGMPGLAQSLKLDAQPGTVPALAPSEPRQRISLNLAAIAASKQLYLHITGADKRALFDRARSGDAEVADLPIATLVAKLGERLIVYWAP